MRRSLQQSRGFFLWRERNYEI
ncbi:MAG TPA: hypothetical protein DEB37_11580 [Lysinibacillus sp.]|nr:hypothetical protein [Lysinibacillus sp.]